MYNLEEYYSIGVETKRVAYVLDANKEIPQDFIGDFDEWLESMALTLDTGEHREYFAYTEDYKDDISVDLLIRNEKL